MSETTNSPEDPVLEDARRRLQAIMGSSSTGGSGLYLQQVAQAGLSALEMVPSYLEAQQLAEIIAQQVDDVCNSLQNITHIDKTLENDLLEFLGAVSEPQEEIPNVSDGVVAEKLASFRENLEEISARVMWRIVANDDSEHVITEEEEVGGPSHCKLTSQTANGNDVSPSNSLGSTNSPLIANTPNGNTGDSASPSVEADRFMALLLQLVDPSGTPASDTILTDQFLDPSTMPADSALSTLHLSRTLDAKETCQRGIDLLNISMREVDPRGLYNSISLFRESLLLCSSDSPLGLVATGNLAAALFTRYEREGSLLDLLEAIEHYREVLKLHPPDHPDRPKNLNNLSNALFTRYQREGSLLDLSEATERYREALQLRPPGHPDRASSLNNLSAALFTRYQHEGSLLDLSEATEHHREALQLYPPGHPDRAKSLINLSNALMIQYECKGSLPDLSEATEQYREALQLQPPGHPDRAASLNNLSNALFARYQREGSLLDLSEATERYREALQLRPPGHPHHASSLNNLSNALFTRYQREGSLMDLLEATEQYKEALQLHPPGHPDRAKSLYNLSNALLTRYEHKGSLLDLLEATEQYRDALQLCPPGHPDRASSLYNLSNALITRFQHDGSLLHLSEATEQRREVLKLHPYGHPERTQALSSLSRALVHTIGVTHDTSNIHYHQALVQEVFEALREAVNLPGCPPLHRLRAAVQWIDTARQLASDSMLDAYAAALDQLDIVLATRDTLENKHDQLISSEELSRCKQLGVEAASYAVRQGHMALAVELLERGRNLLFAQVGRYRVDLEELRKADAELADRFSSLSRLLDTSVVSTQPTLEGRSAFEDPIERYRRVSSDWSQAVDNIRALEGFDSFLRSPKYDTLRSAAAGGPVIIVIPDEGNSVALIISHERPAPYHVNLPKAGTGKLEKLCSALEEAVHSDDELAEEESVERILRSLWDLVVRPIADVLENKLHIPLRSRIWWCPTSLFSLLPLHAAGHYTSEDTAQNLPDRYVSSYTPTLHALMRAQSSLNYGIRKEEKMLIVAQPDTPGQVCLPDVQREAELVKKLVETQMACALYSSKEGTRAAIVDAMDRYSWLHLTCHGSQHFLNPFQSSFHLWDGNLTLHDIIQRGLPDAKFAFLAACHTATGDRELMDEGLHLAAGLQFAGFKSVVGTIWEVADIDGPVIAEAFYEALQLEPAEGEGMDCSRAAHALNKAVKKLRDSGVPISRWMRFIHIGI